MDYLEISELYHHGIKGQKWGVRRYVNEDGTLTAEGKARYGVDEHGKMSAEGMKQYKQDFKQQKADDRKAKIANRSTAGNVALGGVKGAAKGYLGANAVALGVGAVGAASVALAKVAPDKVSGQLLESGFRCAQLMGLISKDAKKIGEYGAVIGAVKGGVESHKAKKDLNHSGIKGQKWGVRRYQNEDGTLTDAGKARYNADGTKKRLEKMSDFELNKANQRLSAERNYNALIGKNYKNRSSSGDIAIKAGASAITSALASGGAYLIREATKNPGTSIGKDKMKTAAMLAALGATIGTLTSVGTSLGGNTVIQNIGDQKKKK